MQKSPSESKQKMTRRIGTFMRRTAKRRTSHFLQRVCHDSNMCLAFGVESKKIKKFFNDFSFEYALSPTRLIGSESVNGFVREIHYAVQDYHSYAILKSSSKASADNLMYEYNVGLYVNQLNVWLPCFLETYGLFRYRDPDDWEQAKTQFVDATMLQSMLVPMKINYFMGCQESAYLAIMIQHIKAVSLKQKMQELLNTPFRFECLYLLYQIYMCLNACKNTFTHYDLHGENVLVLEPTQGKYIQYHYHIKNRVTKFKSKYMAKIIDYGRSYFKNNKTKESSLKVYNTVCKLCTPDCGSEAGFAYLKDASRLTYIVSQKKNITHDLQLCYDLEEMVTASEDPELTELFSHFARDGMFDVVPDLEEKIRSGLPEDAIHNVSDMFQTLAQMLKKNPNREEQFEFYSDPANKLGDLHIYDDGTPMKFQGGNMEHSSQTPFT